MFLVKRSTSLWPYRSMTQEGMTDRVRGEAWSPRNGGGRCCTPARAAPRRAHPLAAPRDSMAGELGRARPHSRRLAGWGWVTAVPAPLRVQPYRPDAACPPSSSRPSGARGQWVAAFLAVLPMVPLGVTARWRRPAAELGEGLRRTGGREAAGSGPLCCAPLSAR